MPEAAAILARVDRLLAELLELRAELAASMPPPANGSDAGDDFADGSLIEISTAVDRFNRPADTLRRWCREDGDGVKVGGRWLASVPRIRRRLNGG